MLWNIHSDNIFQVLASGTYLVLSNKLLLLTNFTSNKGSTSLFITIATIPVIKLHHCINIFYWLSQCSYSVPQNENNSCRLRKRGGDADKDIIYEGHYGKWLPMRFLFFLTHFNFLHFSPRRLDHTYQIIFPMKVFNWTYSIVIGTFSQGFPHCFIIRNIWMLCQYLTNIYEKLDKTICC